MPAVKGNGRGGARPNTGGARPNAGRKRGGHNRATLERKAMLEKAAEQGLMPIDFLLSEMRNPENSKEMRLELARWAAPYLHPKLAATTISGRLSLATMSDDDLRALNSEAEQALGNPPVAGKHPAGAEPTKH